MKSLDVLGTGLRYPNGIGVNTDGSVVLASMQEGNWSPASGISEVKDGHYYGFGGPKKDRKGGYEKPMVYLPRGEDSSSGGQAYIDSDRWGPLKGNWIHLAMSLGEHFLVLREVVNGKSQAAAVPLWGSFLSGAHRARMSPYDGQLYVAGTQGYLNYGVRDGSLQRLRYTGGYFHYPSAYETRANGILLTFAQAQPEALGETGLWFAQHWNYRYSLSYGSEEYSPSQPQQKGHDMLQIKAVHRLSGGKQIFVEIPQLQPVDQLHLFHKASVGRTRPLEIFATVHNLGKAFTDFPGYREVPKVAKAAFFKAKQDPKTMMTACIACHHETQRVVGPPLAEIRKRYANNPQGIVKWAMNPVNQTPNTPPMPSFSFAGEENLMIIAKQILEMK
jgi:cytochrome c551/c552